MENFYGVWKSESSSGFEDYLKALGVSMPLRKIAAMQNPSVEVKDEGDGKYLVKTVTTFKSHSVVFSLGTEFDEDTPDGRKVKTTFEIEDGKLKQKQLLNGELSSLLIRELDGDKLRITATAGEAVYVRTYTKE